MSLRFIYGRAGSGKSSFCLNDIKNKTNEGVQSPLILLVPEQFSFQAEKNLLYVVGEKGILKAQVLSFTRMAYKVFNVCGGTTRKLVNSSGKCMLIYKILEDVKKEFTSFAKAGNKIGFVSTLLDMITELKRYDISPDTLKDALLNIEDGGELKEKIHDINLVFSRFEAALHERYVDSEDELSMLAEKLDGCSIFDGAEIWIDEFSSFVPQQYKVIEKLFKKAKRINLTLDLDFLSDGSGTDSTDVFSPVKKTEVKFLNIIRENNISYDKPVQLKYPYRFRESKSLGHLEKFFFSFPFETFRDKNSDIQIFKASNLYSEVENAARNIVSLCRDKNMKFSDITVVTRELETYERLVEVIFSQYDIPYFIDERKNIDDNPIIVFLSAALNIFSSNWSYESVFRYLKCGLLDIEREDIDLLENYVLAHGIKGHRWTDEDDWKYEIEVDDKINEMRRKITGPLLNFYGKIDKKKSDVKKICTGCFEFMEEVEIPQKIEMWVDRFKKSKNQELANEYSKVWNTVMEIFDQMVEVMGDDEIDVKQFVNMFNIGVANNKVGVIPPLVDQVLVGSIERIKSHEVRAVFILGVNDSVFPKSSLDEGILSDRDRENLKKYGVELAQSARERAFEEEFLVYVTLTTASNCLYISYPSADFEGRALRPSIIISRIKKIFPEICEKSDIIKSEDDSEALNLVSSPKATFNELIPQFRNFKDKNGINSVWVDVCRWYKQNKDWKDKYYNALKGLSYTNLEPHVNPFKIKKLYGNDFRFSTSKIEKYVSCPFAYYIEYGLKAKDRKVYEFSPPDAGTFMHEAIKKFSNSLEMEGTDWRKIDEVWSENTISIIVDDVLKENSNSILNSSPRYKYMVSRLKKILSTSVSLIGEHIKRSKFTPAGYEVKVPKISLNLPSGDKIDFTGRIDRIDKMEAEDGTYIRIIDYKSGKKGFKLSDVYYGLEIQLLLYLDAVLSDSSEYVKKGAIPGAIFYFRLDDPIIHAKGDEADEVIKNEIMKNLKMSGLLLDNTEVVRDMDSSIEGQRGYSLIIPAQINKNGSLSGNSSKATLDEFNVLRKYTRKIIIGFCSEMLKGNISISPFEKKGYTSCDYCEYSDICRFDRRIPGNKYRVFCDMKNDEAFELIKGQVDENELDR